jgi:alpha-beta hydrolase superfamily lysophospholipase
VTIKEHRPIIDGYPLFRLVLTPDQTPRGSLLFFHGQGDFVARYPPILDGFVKAGYQCLLTDLPGHGRSPGTRGEVPGLEFIDKLFYDSLSQLEGPFVIAGHSMGGLMALRFLLRYPKNFQSAWISSPLLDPMRQAAPWMKVLLPMISEALPWLTVSTGVRSEDCGDNQSGRKNAEEGALYHSRVSLSWGRNLRDAAQEVGEQFPTLPSNLPILFTQGEIDPICPSNILEGHLKKLPDNQVRFEMIPNALHEPFTGSTTVDFLSRLNRWIKDELSSD